MTAKTAPTITLRRGAEIPHIGLGTHPLNDVQSERAVISALEAGYRLIDTAEVYENEVGVGKGLRASGVSRDDVFITSKFTKQWHGPDLRTALQRSTDRLGVDYLDLYLIHWPHPTHDRYVAAFEGLLSLYDDGLVRAIGTSNFKSSHLDRLLTETGQLPDVNQIQLSPDVARSALRSYHFEHGILTESWAPLGGPGSTILQNPAIRGIADRHGKSPAQVVLRWHIELGLIPIPKSASPTRMVENLDVFDFSLSHEELDILAGRDLGDSLVVDSDALGVGA